MSADRFKNYFLLLKQMGPTWFLYRSFYELQKKTGLLQRMNTSPRRTDEMLPENIKSKQQLLQVGSSCFYQTSSRGLLKEWMLDNLQGKDKETIIEIADASLEGKIYCFSSWFADYGYPIDWHLNPITGNHYPGDRHWTRLNELTEGEDIKLVWEASRFPHVYYLARAYLLTDDEKYPEAFWEQIEHWWQSNPFGYGPNWFCGQEVALRALTWIFGLHVFQGSEHTTSVRIKNLYKCLWQHGLRIEKNINFALKALGNNHAISEAAGLFTLGLLFPFFQESGRWLRKGQEYLTREGLRQIFEDGSYIQNSFNYQRMVVQLYSWCLRLAQLNNISFSPELINRLEKCVLFLHALQEKSSGFLPNYGANDGALPFPLTACAYGDYRPQLNALWCIVKGKRLYGPGMHDEELLWFVGEETAQTGLESMPAEKAFHDGGYYVLQGGESWGLTRCTTFRHRPGHADMLHLDLWWKGQNILVDAGSYSYNDPATRGYFNSTLSHNTVEVNGRSQMKRWQRFTWLDWTKAKLLYFESNPEFSCFEGEHYGYPEAVHRRCIICRDQLWIIVDDLLPAGGRRANIRVLWLLGSYPCAWEESGDLGIQTENGDLRMSFWNQGGRARAALEKGWRSMHYGQKEEVPCAVVETVADLPYRLITLLYPGKEIEVKGVNDTRIEVEGQTGTRVIQLNSTGEKGILKL